MELVLYTTMAAGACVALILKRPAIVYGWIGIFVLYSLAARLSPQITGDMGRYYEAARTWPSPSLYTLREPVLWYAASLLHWLLRSEIAAFLTIDFLNAFIVFRAMKLLDADDHRMVALVPTILSSYIVVLGQQNGYRQYTSFAIFLMSIATGNRNTRLSFALFVISFFTHNVTAIFFGYWLDSTRREGTRYGPSITVMGVLLLQSFWPILRKSSSFTGLDTSYWYIALVASILVGLLYARNGRFKPNADEAIGPYNFLAFTPAIWVLASDQFERVSMYFLVLVIVGIQRYRDRIAIRGGMIDAVSYAILVPPVFMFVNVYSKLL